jgi:hypothetical protein
MSMQDDDIIDFKPSFRDRQPKKLSTKDWLNYEEPQVILFQGGRGGGKGVSVERTAERLYNEGFNVWHLWSARSYENLFWSINKNCKDKYSKMKVIAETFYQKDNESIVDRCMKSRKFESKKEFKEYWDFMVDHDIIKINGDGTAELLEDGQKLATNEYLHCNCSKSYPILWFAPDYIEFDQSSLDRFNGQCWKDLEEYAKYNSDITTENKKLLLEGKLKKPKELQTKELIKIQHFTPPTTKARLEKFREDFVNAVLQAREERRIFVISPAIFEGQMDKFETIAEIFKMIKWIMNSSGHFMELKESEHGSRKNWTKKMKGWHKVAIVINELRSVSPSSKMHGEKGASSSKKAIFDYIPEARHFKTWFLGDYQNPSDLFDGVRHQANLVIIKRASANILGGDWTWLFDKVLKDRFGFIRGKFHKPIEKPEQVYYFESKSPKIKRYNDDRRPFIGNLPDNTAYVTWPNNELRKVKFDMPSFHHKQSLDDFKRITGIDWSINTELKPKENNATKEDVKETTKENKARKEDLMKRIQTMHEVENKTFKVIKDEIAELEVKGIIQDMGYASKTPKYFNDTFLKWKKKKSLLSNV